MTCPRCGTENSAAATRCTHCSTALNLDSAPTIAPSSETLITRGASENSSSASDFGPTVGVAEGWSSPGRGTKIDLGYLTLQPGSVLGGRYEILQLLGEGGMGAVYKARDREVDRYVALKVIRPELARQPEVLQRFKQELILARQVTHRNVIRIFDLGEAEGIKYISMDYLEGRDLRGLLREKGKLGPDEATKIIIQVCGALDAAHAEGVVHRDLKPQNIMVDGSGRAVVMDFGIARSMEMTALTQTGALVGTPEYMSPEQAKGQEADSRSDLFTLGIIFYELLTGKTPYRAETVLGTLLKRTQERARPPVELDETIPRYLSDVVMKCLEIDPERRYQKASEIAADLEARRRTRSSGFTLRMPRFRTVEEFPTKWIAPALAVILLILAVVLRGRLFGPEVKPPAQSQPAVSLAILPFRNASGDPTLDWLHRSLAGMLSTDMGESSLVQTVPSNRIFEIFHRLRIAPDTAIDHETLQQIAQFSSADHIVSGNFIRLGNEIRIEATIEDLKQQRGFPLKASAAGEKDLPRAIERLAADIQKTLALPDNAIKELKVSTLKPSTQSVQALRYYTEGLELARQGKNVEAAGSFVASTKEDPKFALAHAKLGQSYANLGYSDRAEQETRKAVELSEHVTAPEKYLITAIHAQAAHNSDKAISSYEDLAKILPQDPDVQIALAGLYNTTGSLAKAREHYGRLLARDPKYVEALYGLAGVEINAGDPQKALEHLNSALPTTVQLGNDLERSMILYGLGVAYAQMNKPEDALGNYEQALNIQRRLGDKHASAQTLNGMAQVQDALGKSQLALKSFQEALQLRRELGDKVGEGDTLIDLSNYYEARGQNDDALRMLRDSLEIQQAVGNQAYEALCYNNIGANYADKGQYGDARVYFDKALQLRENLKDPGAIAETHYLMADTLVKLGQYDKALTHYMKSLDLWRSVNDNRRVAFASYSLAILFEQQGRLGAALDSKQEALQAIREVQDRIGIAQILGGYAASLDLVGRAPEAQKSLDEALALSRELKNQPLIAQNLNFQGDSFFYRGQFGPAKASYQQAVQIASKTTDRRLVLVSKFNLAKVAVKEGHSREAIAALRALATEADSLGLKYLSLECSLYLGEAYVDTKNFAGALQELDRTRRTAEQLGLLTVQAKSEYLLATAFRLTGKTAEATRQYNDARKTLDAILKEAKSDQVLNRADLKTIYADSAKWSPPV